MNTTISFVLLVVFAFFAAHLINRYTTRFIPISGAEYLLIGVLVGPLIPSGLLSRDALAKLTPVLSLLLGLSGFLIGLQVTRRLRPLRATLVGLGVALSTLVALTAVFATAYVYLLPLAEAPLFRRWLYELGGFNLELVLTRPQLTLSIVLGATATVTFASALSGLEDARRANVPAFRLLEICAIIGQFVAICVVAAVLAWGRSRSTSAIALPALGWFAGVVVLGVALGFCFTFFIGHEQAPARIFVVTVGTVTFGAGVGAELGVSPMFVNLVTGVTVAMTSRHRRNLKQELRRLQHPISVLLLVLAGALWVPPEHARLWLFPVVYLLARWVARMTLPALWTRALTTIEWRRVGVGLLSQGTLAVAVAVDFALQSPERAGVVLTTAIVGTLVFDVFGHGALRRYLIDAEAESDGSAASHWPQPRAGA